MNEHALPQISHYEELQKNVLIKPEIDKLPAEFQRITEQLKNISGSWNPVEFVTPSSESIKREKGQFFAAFQNGERYNPSFDYTYAESLDADPDLIRQQLLNLLQETRAISVPAESDENTRQLTRIARVALYNKIKDDLASLDLLIGIRTKDEKRIGEATKRKYAPTDPVLNAIAQARYEGLTQPTQEETISDVLLSPEQQKLLTKESYSAEQIKAAFEWILSQYGILKSEQTPQGFQVKISSEVTAIDVRDKSTEPMTIFIPENRVVSGQKLLELCYHEIEGHARQSMNGMRMLIGGGALKVDDETLYEGLAKRLDEDFNLKYFGKKAGIPVPFYTIATQQAESGASFSDIFLDQLDKQLHVLLQIPPNKEINWQDSATQTVMSKGMEAAWRFTYRVMRGHTDMSNPESYAFGKDLAYLRGWLLDKSLGELNKAYVNEAAIMQTDALALMGRVDLRPEDLAYPYTDITKRYCFEVLLPEIDSRTTAPTL